VSQIVFNATLVFLLLLMATLAVMPAFHRRRLGWFGVPLGVALASAAMFETLGMGLSGYLDLLPLLYGAAAAAVMGWRLPRPDSVAAVVAGPVLAVLLGYALGASGPDNPMPFVIAGCGLAFMLGGGASAVFDHARARRTRKALVHG
jgi:hypothetical protein